MVSPTSMGEIFSKKSFWWGALLEEIYGKGLLHMMRLVIRSCQGRESFIKTFSNNLNTVNVFANHVGIFTWRLSPDQIYARIYPWVNSLEKVFKSFLMFSFPHVDPELGYWYIIWKVDTLCLFSFFDIFSGYLHFDVLIIGTFRFA